MTTGMWPDCEVFSIKERFFKGIETLLELAPGLL
jgi:hypothetical protein